MEVLEAQRRAALVLLASLLLLALLGILSLGPYAVLPLLFRAVLLHWGYARGARRVLGEEAARRLGLAFSPKGELPKARLPDGRSVVAVPLLPEGEPEVHGELRGEVLGHPFRRFQVSVYGAKRFGLVGYRFSGVLYQVELSGAPFPQMNRPLSLPVLHLAPRGWPTYPRERWPFFLALLGLSGALLALLAQGLTGLPVLKPGASALLLLVFPALFFYLLAAWRVATREIGPRVALEGELARRFRAWGYTGAITGESPLGRALLKMWRALGPFWLRVEGSHLFLAFPGGNPPTSLLLPPQAALARWVGQLRREVEALAGLAQALEAGPNQAHAETPRLEQSETRWKR